MLPILTVNDPFLREFVSAAAPRFAWGLVEKRKWQLGCVALGFEQPVPRAVWNWGFRFGHGILGNDRWQVMHFSFEVYGWQTYHALLNVNN